MAKAGQTQLQVCGDVLHELVTLFVCLIVCLFVFIYVPHPFLLSVDCFVYSSSAVTIDVIAGNDPPVAVNDSVTTNEDTLVVIDALLMDNGFGVDSDPNGDTLTPLSVTAPANGNAIVNTDGTFEYTPNAGFFGLDSFVYTISDGNAGTTTATGM